MKYVTGLVLVPLFKIKTDAKMSAVTDLTQQSSIVRRHKKVSETLIITGGNSLCRLWGHLQTNWQNE